MGQSVHSFTGGRFGPRNAAMSANVSLRIQCASASWQPVVGVG